jgi:hypothetical protein
MGLANPAMVLLTGDVVLKSVFGKILKDRSVMFKDIVESVARPPEQVEVALSRLKNENLIEESTAPIRDFNSYYVTAGGLDAERVLRNVDPGLTLG